MFAVVAAILFALAAFGVVVGSINLVWLGLAFLALHFAYEISLPIGAYRRREP
jgi:hypothetical protein